MITLVLGGARSGKSKRAEILADASKRAVTYVATSIRVEGDKEWERRILKHQEQRPSGWKLIEEPLLLGSLLRNRALADSCLLVDCLTLWLNNVMYKGLNVQQESELLCAALQTYAGDVILVSNELGLGLVPESQLEREFRDAQGLLNQSVAAVADHVEFVAAGLPLVLKGEAKEWNGA